MDVKTSARLFTTHFSSPLQTMRWLNASTDTLNRIAWTRYSDGLSGKQKLQATMAYETSPHQGRQKTRSASICAPSTGSLETILNPPDRATEGTPGYQRRRPATRSQSARITGARSVSWLRNAEHLLPHNTLKCNHARTVHECTVRFRINGCC